MMTMLLLLIVMCRAVALVVVLLQRPLGPGRCQLQLPRGLASLFPVMQCRTIVYEAPHHMRPQKGLLAVVVVACVAPRVVGRKALCLSDVCFCLQL